MNREGGRSTERATGVLREAFTIAWRADRRGTIVAGFLQAGSAVGALGVVAASKLALDAILASDGVGPDLVAAMVLLAFATALSSVVGVIQAQHQRVVGERVSQRIWRGLLATCVQVDLATWESTDFMARLDRVRQNALGRPAAVVAATFAIIGSGLTAVSLIVALLLIQPLLVPILVLVGVPTVFLSRVASRSEFRFATAVNPVIRRRIYVKYLLSSRPVAAEVRAFQSGDHLLRAHAREDATYLAKLREQARRRQFVGLATAGVSAMGLAATLVLIVALVGSGQISLAEAGAAAIATRLLASQLTAVFAGSGTIIEAGPFMMDLRGFLRLEKAYLGPAPSGRELMSGLRLTGVAFSYPGAALPALRGVDLHVRRGSVVAVVGENGSGKTTLAKVVAGLLSPDAGSVAWDNSKIDPADLRSSVTVLFQDFVRYQLSAGDNITIADTAVPPDLDRLVAAADRADIHETLSGLPSGYETYLGVELADGVDLSGGQWQRVALARALYRDKSLVVLDEPTASMDPRAEHELFGNIRKMLAGRAALLISHRYSSVKLADYIYVLDAGSVVEEGTHADLVALGGRYAELYALQAAAYL